MSTKKLSWAKVAKQLLGKKAVQNQGDDSDGQFVFVTPCRNQVGFSLWATKEAAEKSKRGLDRAGCGGECEPWTHYIVDLEKGAAAGVTFCHGLATIVRFVLSW